LSTEHCDLLALSTEHCEGTRIQVFSETLNNANARGFPVRGSHSMATHIVNAAA
jgi:hypothetical protein